MSLPDMQVFNTQLQSATVTKLEQQSDKFNAASNNSLMLVNAGNMGDYTQTSFWNNVSSAIRAVDAYAANASASATALTQSIINTVKTMNAFGPVEWEPNQITWIQKNPEEALSVISQSLADAMMQNQLNKAIGSLVAAISNVASATNDISGSAGVSQGALNNTHAKFGDSSQMLTTQIMDGTRYHNLIGDAIANTGQLFVAGNIQVVDILGKRTIVTDSPDLYEAGTPNKAKILCLTSGACMIEPNGDFTSNIETTNGQTRLERTFQAEWTENVGIKGYSWDTANGGKSPTDAELRTGSNWDIELGLKQTAGAILIADADL